MRTSRIAHLWGSARGFTIVELMMATAVFGMIMGTVFTVLVSLQRFQAVCLARSGQRTEIIRLFDSLEVDLRSARAVAASVSGSVNVLPLTLTVPQRYSTYEITGDLSGDPARNGTRVQPTVNTVNGKLVTSSDITVRYAAVANGASTQNITRTVAWTQAGAVQSASRIVATVPTNTTITFRSSGSTSLSPSPFTISDVALVAKVNAPLSVARASSNAGTAMESTIFLRRKNIK